MHGAKSASPSSQESLRRLPWCTCVSASARQSRAQCCAREFCCKILFVGRVVGGDRRIPSYGGEYRYAREDKDVDVQLLLFESFGGFGKGVGAILWRAANALVAEQAGAGPVPR